MTIRLLSRGAFDPPARSVRSRLVALYVLACLPIVLVAGGFALRASSLDDTGAMVDLFLAALAVALGAATMWVGSEPIFGQPLRLLTGMVRRWRADGGRTQSETRPLLAMPPEFADLAGAFDDATAKLMRREAELEAASAQQDMLLQEMHHRVKNNLQIVASLLNLQANRIRVPEARAEFQAASDRVRALATLHRHLYAHGKLTTVDMPAFLTEICGNVAAAMRGSEDRITLRIQADPIELDSDHAVPLALIVTEGVGNAFKYAFPGDASGHVIVALNRTRDGAVLEITDDGVGLPEGPGESESGARDGLGLQLMRGFARQLGSELEIILPMRGGTRYRVALRMPAPADAAVTTARPEAAVA